MASLAELIGTSPGITAVREQVERFARQVSSRRQPPILIEGETGTGKGLVARLIHACGPRASRPFVDVNCAAIPETLIESELFGYERGAFTDARQAKPGLFQLAHSGTIFLDEIGLLPETVQAKLLKVIEERAVRRLGGTRGEPVDIAILSATNEDLDAAVRERRFRADLYHRLAVLKLALPALRERGDDVLVLADHYLAAVSRDYGLPPHSFAPDARAALRRYPWPGNVRELRNVIERAALIAEAPRITAAMLGLPEIASRQGSEATRGASARGRRRCRTAVPVGSRRRRCRRVGRRGAGRPRGRPPRDGLEHLAGGRAPGDHPQYAPLSHREVRPSSGRGPAPARAPSASTGGLGAGAAADPGGDCPSPGGCADSPF